MVCKLIPPCTTRRRQAGISLIEVLFGAVVLSVALLAHVSSTISEFRLSRTERTRSEVLIVARQFVERMRSDDDWAGLYDRLRTLQVLADTPGPGVRLKDGRRAFAPRAYYPDFVLPPWLSEVAVLVDVPASGDAPPALREDLALPAFGLPADLNGDGTIETSARNADYEALPVVVMLTWHPTGETAHELRLSTWLRGSR